MKLKIITAFVFTALSAVAEVKKPNFIIIYTDDQGYQDLGCYGSPDIKTPRIDQMAEEGMKFTSFYAQTVCGPSRVSLMTGSYPMRTKRVNDNWILPHPAMDSDEVTIPEVLKTVGYKTGMAGKWDMAGRIIANKANTFDVNIGPHKQGFDSAFWSQKSDVKALYQEQKKLSKTPKRASLTEFFTNKAIEFIEANKEDPFFFYLAHPMPHTPLAASKQFKGKSEAGIYGDVMMELDFHTGRLLDKVKELGLDENTYVIYASDNGPWWKEGDHAGHCEPLRSAKTSTYDGGVRVPFIIRAPGKVPVGISSDLVTATIDILPTIAELAGAKVPSDRVIDGIDLSKVFHGTQAELDRPFFYYQHQSLRAVRQGDWKLHLPYTAKDKTGPGKAWLNHVPKKDRPFISEVTLYNLKEDIGESTNVAKENPDVVAKLMKQLEWAKKDIGEHDSIGENSRRAK